MTEPETTDKRPRLVARRYLIDRPSQVSVALHVAGVIAGIGLLYAFAVFVVLGSDTFRGKTVGESRLMLLAVHTGYFVIGGAILVVLVLLLTHRFAGPGYVMRQAVERMRRGDYSARLNLRPRDYHKDLARQLTLLQEELAERDRAHAEPLRGLEQASSDGDLAEARLASDSTNPA